MRLRQSITSGGDAIEWPLEVALAPRGGDADRVYLAVATARDEGGEALAEVRAISGYQKGKTVSLLLLFEDSCLRTVGLCSPEQTCRSGGCVDAHVDVARLPVYERDPNGEPILTPHWSTDAGARPDAATDDAGADAGDGGPGTPDAAPPPQCTRAPDCDDGDPCNGAESCTAGRCGGAEPFACPQLEEACRVNVCVNDDGEARCEAQSAHEGESCRDADDTSEPSASCARDYACREGECVAVAVDDCEADGPCEQLGGCDPDDGCVIAPKAAGDECDDGDACTVDDQCNGDDFTCAGAALDCTDPDRLHRRRLRRRQLPQLPERPQLHRGVPGRDVRSRSTTASTKRTWTSRPATTSALRPLPTFATSARASAPPRASPPRRARSAAAAARPSEG